MDGHRRQPVICCHVFSTKKLIKVREQIIIRHVLVTWMCCVMRLSVMWFWFLRDQNHLLSLAVFRFSKTTFHFHFDFTKKNGKGLVKRILILFFDLNFYPKSGYQKKWNNSILKYPFFFLFLDSNFNFFFFLTYFWMRIN